MVEQSQPPCADGQTARILEAEVLVELESQTTTPSQSCLWPSPVEGSSLGMYPGRISFVSTKGLYFRLTRIHQGIVIPIRRSTNVDLPGVAAAVTIGCTCWLQTSTIYVSMRLILAFEETYLVSPAASTAGNGTQPL